jgi:hypothetical protein
MRRVRKGRAGQCAASSLLLIASLAGCAGPISNGKSSGATPQALCEQLAGTTIPAAALGLPTRGAIVSSATLVLATDAGNSNGEYCKVLAAIRPVDTTAPDINIQVNLPTTWNGKALQLGGGGYNGSLVTGLNQVPYGPVAGATPLAAGYVTLGSDSGHKGQVADGSFALNNEALVNFGGDQLKKTRDAAVRLMRARYGRAAKRFYIAGSSQGGHEVFLAVQRWPKDYDGAIATHPVYNFTMLQTDGNALARTLYANGGAGWLNPRKLSLLQSGVMGACDPLDGVADGVISNLAACQTTFKLAALRCPGGTDAGDTCLSDAQIAVVNTVNSRFELGFPLQGGITSFARWPILEGADWTGLFGFGTRPVPASPPAPIADFGLHVLADPMVRYFITRNPAVDSLTFDPRAHAERLRAVSEIVDASSPDIEAFRARGGKMLLMHGTVDSAVPHHNTIDYYDRLVARFGQRNLDGFVRFYLVPGFGHGTGQFIASWDSLTALEAWVEQGRAPGTLAVTDSKQGNNSRTRPLCIYPQWPKYNGSGDVNAAASFTCAGN